MLPSTIVVGAGPAGLSAAYHLSKLGFPVTVLESDPVYVGGISRTVHFQGFHFDIGGHRFFSKSERIEALWREILPNDFLERPRLSRILYNRRLFAYPLKPVQALFDLGVIESLRCVLSYAYARLRPIRNPRSFEQWVTNEFGSRLYQIFFKTYTEKVWGMSCADISADWAAQRIKGVSLMSAVLSALTPAAFGTGRTIKSLISTFRYPRLGPGMLWDACAEAVRRQGGAVTLGRTVVDLRYDDATAQWTVGHTNATGEREEHTADHVISSAPLREIVPALSPAPSPRLRSAAEQLAYRDFLTVALVLKDRQHFADNWIYVHDSSVMVGRIQNFKSWSPEMVPDPSLTCYGLEYFCFEGDGLWASTDAELIARATDELVAIGLADRDDVLEGCVVRQKKAYPVYDDAYAQHVQTIRDELEEQYPRLHLVGRNGMHKYNNQDHAMMTALLTAENIVAGHPLHDPWRVNEDAEYHEEVDRTNGASGLREVPSRLKGVA